MMIAFDAIINRIFTIWASDLFQDIFTANVLIRTTIKVTLSMTVHLLIVTFLMRVHSRNN